MQHPGARAIVIIGAGRGAHIVLAAAADVLGPVLGRRGRFITLRRMRRATGRRFMARLNNLFLKVAEGLADRFGVID